MRYGGSEAYELGYEVWEQQDWRADLSPVEGGRLDERARREASPSFVRVVRIVVTLALMLFVAGGVSVALTAGTVATLQSNTKISSQIKEMGTQNGDLRIERSLLASGDRISRIATQNMDMVYANDAHVLVLD